MKDTAQRGLGLEIATVEAAGKKAVLSTDFFLPDDAQGLFVGSERLDRYLKRSGLEWVVRLRGLLEELDYSGLMPAYQSTGRRAVSPRAMLGLIVYGIIERQSSLRDLEALAVRDVGAWWICGGNQPDHSTIGKFVQTHAAVLSEEFFMTLVKSVAGKLRLRAGLVAADGTVVEAVASRYSLIRAEAAREAAEEARREAEAHPEDAQAKAAAAAASAVVEVIEERAENRRDRGRDPEAVQVAPAEPEAVVQPRKDGVVRPSYKPSVLVHESGLIVGQHVDGSSETSAIQPMLQQHAVAFQAMPTTILLDAGYFSGELLESLLEQELDVLCPAGRTLTESWEKQSYGEKFPKEAFQYDDAADSYRCPAGQDLRFDRAGADQCGRRYRVYSTEGCAGCELRPRCTKSVHGRTIKRYEHDHLKEAMRQVLRHPAARRRYRQRAPIAETPFAVLGQTLGLKRFHRRGLVGTRVEFALYCMAFDLRKAVASSALMALVTVFSVHPAHGRRFLGLIVLCFPWSK